MSPTSASISFVTSISQTVPFTWANNSSINMTISVPIKGLRSSYDVLTSAANFEDLKNHESFSFTVNGTLSPSPVTQTLPFIIDGSGNQRCVRVSTGVFECPTPALTSVPHCVGNTTIYSNAMSLFHDIGVSTPTNQKFSIRSPASSTDNLYFEVLCTKTGNDLKEAFQKKLSGAIAAKNIVYEDEFHTDERRTNRVWRNKPVYRKCKVGVAVLGEVIATGVEEVISFGGNSSWTVNYDSQIPVFRSDTAYFIVYVNKPANTLTEQTAGPPAGRAVRYCAEYTKL